MKYYLNVDRGSYYKRKEERYINIDLTRISSSLCKDNNFKELCIFTMTFDTERDLKKFLIDLGVLPSKMVHFDLKITYEFKGIFKELEIPYHKHEQYIDLNSLILAVVSKCEDPAFINKLIVLLQKNYKIPLNYVETLRVISQNYTEKYRLHGTISNLFNRICRKEGKINYRQLYELAMLLFPLLYVDAKENIMEEQPPLGDFDLTNLTEAQRFKAMEWGLIDDYEEPLPRGFH